MSVTASPLCGDGQCPHRLQVSQNVLNRKNLPLQRTGLDTCPEEILERPTAHEKRMRRRSAPPVIRETPVRTSEAAPPAARTAGIKQTGQQELASATGTAGRLCPARKPVESSSVASPKGKHGLAVRPSGSTWGYLPKSIESRPSSQQPSSH